MIELCRFLHSAVEPRFNEPLYNEVLGLMNNIFQPSNSLMYGKVPQYNEPISPIIIITMK